MVPHHADPEDGHPLLGQALPDKYLPREMSWETRDVERGVVLFLFLFFSVAFGSSRCINFIKLVFIFSTGVILDGFV